MIRIYPTTDSGLSHSDYAMTLPAVIFPNRARPQKVATTLDGGAVVTKWAKNYEGAQANTTVQLEEADFLKLRTIVEHATVLSWVVVSLGRRFKACIDITGEPTTTNRRSGFYYEVSLQFTIEEVLT